MEVIVHKFFNFDIYVSVFENINITVHSNGNIIAHLWENQELNLKNFNIYFLKFISLFLTHADVPKSHKMQEIFIKLTNLSSLFVRLQYNVLPNFLIDFFINFTELYKEFLSLITINDTTIFRFVYEMIYMKTFLSHLINNYK